MVLNAGNEQRLVLIAANFRRLTGGFETRPYTLVLLRRGLPGHRLMAAY